MGVDVNPRGRDEQAGGTSLAVHPQIPRVACILNTRGQQAAPENRRSRGELPLRAAAEGPRALNDLHDHPEQLRTYDPFFLICADVIPAAEALMLSWDGTRAALERLEPNNTHVITNAGHTFPSAHQDAKAEHFGPKFAAHRPDADPAATIKDAWGDWLTLAGGDGLSDTEPGAIIARRELPDGRLWGTTSVSLVALGAHGLRYDFQPVPADPTTWYSVLSKRWAQGPQKNSKYSRISHSLTSESGEPEAADAASASSYRRISARFIMTR